jgi:arginine decarboxylase
MAGVGRGRTRVSARDAALKQCGVLDCDLVRRGPVIPPGATVLEADETGAPARGFGDRVDVVMAERPSAVVGRAIAAGIGWYQWDDGRGVFVAQSTQADSVVRAEAALLDLIYTSLRDLAETRRVAFDAMRVGCRLASTEVGAEPAAVVVVAAYE